MVLNSKLNSQLCNVDIEVSIKPINHNPSIIKIASSKRSSIPSSTRTVITTLNSNELVPSFLNTIKRGPKIKVHPIIYELILTINKIWLSHIAILFSDYYQIEAPYLTIPIITSYYISGDKTGPFTTINDRYINPVSHSVITMGSP